MYRMRSDQTIQEPEVKHRVLALRLNEVEGWQLDTLAARSDRKPSSYLKKLLRDAARAAKLQEAEAPKDK